MNEKVEYKKIRMETIGNGNPTISKTRCNLCQSWT